MKDMVKTIKDYGFMFWWRDTKVYDIYRYIFFRFPERLGRAISFARIGWLNHDFDAHYVHEVVLFKLKRLEYCFVHYGYHSEDCENYKPKMKSLKLTIKLLEKYLQSPTIFQDAHDRKWGELNTEWVKVEGSDKKPMGPYWTSNFSRPNANTPEEIEQERKENADAYMADDRRQERILATAYKIIAKYHRYWWD